MLKFICLCFLAFSVNLLAAPSPEVSLSLNPSIVKVHTANKQGNHGVGSGVVISKDHVVTNCHVIADAQGIHITKYGVSYAPYALLADWKHDLCILKFKYLDLQPVNLGKNEKLQYEAEVFNKSYGGNTIKPHTAIGSVKGIYELDNYKIIQSSAWFSLGASGGGLFNEQAELIGITTFKTPGNSGFFYSVPVEIIKEMMQKNEELLVTAAAESPFWDAPEDSLPFFMRVVGPINKENWARLKEISIEWLTNKPGNIEALYHLGLARYRLGELKDAKHSFEDVINHNDKHLQSYLYLYEIAKLEGNEKEMGQYKKAALLIDDSQLADQ